MEAMWTIIEPLLPVLITLLVVSCLLWLADRLFIQTIGPSGDEKRSPRQLVMIGLTLCGVLAVALSLPISDALRADLLRLLGLIFTGLIAFSSTSFVSNMMAGLMLRSVKSYDLGDFIEAGTFFGRVTERGLFHTEIQSEDRDLITLPNLYLATNPVKVVRKSGTAINCVISLGYDVNRQDAEKAFKLAAESCELADPFVQIIELGDYSVTYKAAGFYQDVKHLLTKKSEFKAAIFDGLHSAGIEIVSPAFMNQRILDPAKPVIASAAEKVPVSGLETPPESLLFDKADRAQRIRLLEEKVYKQKELLKTLSKESGEENADKIRKLESQISVSEKLLNVERNREKNESADEQ